MNTQIPLDYIRNCRRELESILSIMENGEENEFYFAQLYYIDEVHSVELSSNFIIPIPLSLLCFYQNTLGKLSSNHPIRSSKIDLIIYLKNYLDWLRILITNEGDTDMISKQEISNLKRFKRGELKKLLEELAIKFNLVKRQTFTRDKLELICTDLKEKGYLVIESSVASTLRDKLDYSIRKI